MTIRIATFNAENLFRRPQAFGLPDDAHRKEVLDDFDELVSLLGKADYQEADKARIAALVRKHRAYDLDPHDPPPIYVNQTRGGAAALFRRSGDPRDPEIHVVAKGRGAWAGWAELVRGDLDWAAVKNTGRVIAEIDADVLLTVEVEDRLTLDRFNTQVLSGVLGRRAYPFNMLIDGNDSRGIDVGILSRHPIRSVRSHIFDTSPEHPGGPVFSRDCPEFEIELDGTPLWVLGNHFKSKAGDDPELRLAQAEQVVRIYRAAAERSPNVLVAGDLNDFLDSPPIRTLTDAGLRDAMSHPAYRGDPGTHGSGTRPSDKLDYLLFPPPLWDRVQHVGVERRGVWAPPAIKSFDTVTSKADEASDHAALYADLDL
ncbi:endonuclease/exonuclease/phosphatase family protein [Streptomyces sp. NPDC086766]|uniref:endonuclease/exonuclease/phosphatase family protein n=1 Tax=Streptomyces sp. NPDC086766 TaxID=3365754 RepID=UPI0037F3ED11